jgi:acylphosphatase
MSECIFLHVTFKGMVQAVGFRWTVAERAKKAEVQGSVENKEDGSVEVKAYGSQAQLDLFLDSLLANPGIARITSYEKKSSPCKLPSQEGFQILRG